MGARTFTFKKGTLKDVYLCEECGVSSRWEIRNLWEVFTLFFIPLIPYWRRAWLVCPSCEGGIKLTRRNRGEILDGIEIDPV
jgi:hypothetical protein